MKILTVAIPCYNSEAYMEKCIRSILPVGEEVEILIVDDGSTKDRTPQIADSYAAKYPTIIRAVHQENGGHGEAVNAGLRNASGLYYKVVDSDDWVNTKSLRRIVDKMKELEDYLYLKELLNNLSPEIREVVILRAYEEVKFKDIAKMMNCSLSTAKSRYRIGIQQMKNMIKEGER